MDVEQERLLAAVIAAHKDRQVTGRTRLQKTIKLLQRLPRDGCGPRSGFAGRAVTIARAETAHGGVGSRP
jgi:hypothetical protein